MSPLFSFLTCVGCCQVCHCPLCKRTFQKRPDLQINRTLREITEQFRSMKKGRGLGKKTGGRGDADIRDFFFDAFRKKRPHAPNKVPLMPTPDSEGKIGRDRLFMASCVKIYNSICEKVKQLCIYVFLTIRPKVSHSTTLKRME